MTSLTSRALRTSSELQPSTSRSEMTARWFAGSASIACATTCARLRSEQPLLRQAARRRRPAARVSARGRRAGTGPRRRPPRARAPGRWSAENGIDAPFALRARLRGVDEDAEDPRLERRAPFEAIERAEHAQPRLLHDLFGDRARRHEDLRDAQERRVPLAHDPAKRLLVAGPESGDEVGVGWLHATNVPEAAHRRDASRL